MSRKVHFNKYARVIIRCKGKILSKYLVEHTGGTLTETKKAMLLNYGKDAKDIKIDIKYVKTLKDLFGLSRVDPKKINVLLQKYRIVEIVSMGLKGTKITVEVVLKK